MKFTREGNSKEGLTRRELLKTSGLAIGGLAVGSAVAGAADEALQCGPNACGYPVPKDQTERYDYPLTLPNFTRNMQQHLDDDEMRITFLGTNFPPARRTQQLMSIFVEVGPWIPDEHGGPGHHAEIRPNQAERLAVGRDIGEVARRLGYGSRGCGGYFSRHAHRLPVP